MKIKEQKVIEIHKDLEQILLRLESESKSEKRLDKVESGLFSSLLILGLKLLKYYIFLVSEIVKKEGRPRDSLGKKMKNTGLRRRPYHSVFGLLSIWRVKDYSKTDKTHYELDKRLGLPEGFFSYLLTDWLSYGAVDLDFEQSVSYLGRILNQNLHATQSSRETYNLSREVDNFYEYKNWDELEEEGTYMSAGFDGKGVPIVLSETARKKESTSKRLGRGEKKGIKKEATVSVSSSFTPKQRTVEEIIQGLFDVEESKDIVPKPIKNSWHEHKHIRAFLSNKKKAISYGIDNLLKRDQSGLKPIIILIDGDRSLRKAVEQEVEKRNIAHRIKAYILDFIHVVEYIWKVANAYKGEKNEAREIWVKQQAKLLLNNKVGDVIKEFERIAKLKEYTSTQAKNIKRSITYFKNHEDMMEYKTYLDIGFPITTGAIESACGHFVKSRMERNGMRWTKLGAQNMLDIRAIKKNDDWAQYTSKFIEKEQNLLYKSAA